MNREEAKKKLWATGKINTLSKVECDKLIDEIYDDYDTEVVSSPLGYLDGFPEFGRYKRNTKYRIYVEEVT